MVANDVPVLATTKSKGHMAGGCFCLLRFGFQPSRAGQLLKADSSITNVTLILKLPFPR